MRLALNSLVERARSSLFLVPMVGVVVAVALAAATLAVDQQLDPATADLPLGLTSTVESARAILSTIAGATITVAAISFSVSLLILQQAATQYSPRVVQTLFRDPFNKRVMGIVVGTFTYCLVVLRSVRSALEEGGSPVVPNLSVAIAVLLGVITILAIVAFIDHSAHSMDVSRILDDIRRRAIDQIRREWTPAADGRTVSADRPGPTRDPGSPECAAFEVRFDTDGWVQEIDVDALVAVVPAGALMHLQTGPGRFAVTGSLICTLSAVPEDPVAVCTAVRDAVDVGNTRTMRQDVSFGLRQLSDVALRALSPGINDPTTAQDAIFHSAAVLAEALRHDPPSAPVAEGRGRLVIEHGPDHRDLVEVAFSETRQAASGVVTVSTYLLGAMGQVDDALRAEGLTDRSGVLQEQADLVLTACRRAAILPADLERVERAYDRNFGPGA